MRTLITVSHTLSGGDLQKWIDDNGGNDNSLLLQLTN